MALNLGKKLVKGEKINLTKDPSDPKSDKVTKLLIGSNWGSIIKKKLFGGKSMESVDLDSSVICYDRNKNLIETVYFGNLSNSNGSIRHSGDDIVGDMFDDGKDNEVITIDLTRIPSNIEYMTFILNSYRRQNFNTIPFARIRVIDASSKEENVLASYEANKMDGIALVLGHMYRKDDGWKFSADGVCTNEETINDIGHGSAVEVL